MSFTGKCTHVDCQWSINDQLLPNLGTKPLCEQKQVELFDLLAMRLDLITLRSSDLISDPDRDLPYLTGLTCSTT